MDKLTKRTIWSFGGFLIAYILSFLFLDRWIDLWVHTSFADTWVHTAGKYISYLGSTPVVDITLCLCILTSMTIILSRKGQCPQWIRFLFYVCISCGLAIIVGEGLKVVLGRYRPIQLFESGKYGLHFFSTQWEMNSTPSGHTLRIFSIMTALALLIPKGKIPFLIVALLVGISRIAVTDHYPSDVLFGAFIGIFTAVWTYHFMITYKTGNSQ